LLYISRRPRWIQTASRSRACPRPLAAGAAVGVKRLSRTRRFPYCVGMGTEHEMTDDEKRRDQLTAAPDATEDDARPRIVVSQHDGVKRIDIADDAPVRPGDPTEDPAPHED